MTHVRKPPLKLFAQTQRGLPKKRDKREQADRLAILAILDERATDQQSEWHKDEVRYRESLRIWRKQLSVGRRLNRITAVGALVGLGGLIALGITIHDARIATVEANRAWIAPFSAEPTGFTFTDTVEFVVHFRNVGKSPALDIHWSDIDSGTKPLSLHGDLGKIDVGENKMCDGLLPAHDAAVAYPNVQTAYDRTFDSGPNIRFSVVKAGQVVPYIRGCVAYTTLGKIGKSAFCFIFTPMVPNKTDFIKGGAAICNTGVWAE